MEFIQPNPNIMFIAYEFVFSFYMLYYAQLKLDEVIMNLYTQPKYVHSL